MHGVESKLAEWHRLYKELEAVRERLRDARSRSAADAELAELEAKVTELRQRSDQALEEMHSAIRAARGAAAAGDEGPGGADPE